MKKLLVFLFSAMLVLALTAGALAAEAKPGDEVTFSLSLQNTNASYARIKASYDASVFELVGYSANSGTAGSAGIVLYDVTSILPSGTVGTVTLRIKDSAKPGTYSVSAVLAECYDRDENNGKASAGGGGSVTVAGSATPAPTATPKPTEKPTAAPTATPKPTESRPPRRPLRLSPRKSRPPLLPKRPSLPKKRPPLLPKRPSPPKKRPPLPPKRPSLPKKRPPLLPRRLSRTRRTPIGGCISPFVLWASASGILRLS